MVIDLGDNYGWGPNTVVLRLDASRIIGKLILLTFIAVLMRCHVNFDVRSGEQSLESGTEINLAAIHATLGVVVVGKRRI